MPAQRRGRLMVRATLIVSLFVASLASAAPAEWTLSPLPAGWDDVTEEAMKDPAMAAQREKIIKAGGTFEATMYAGETDALLVVRSVFGGGTSTMAALNAFLDGVRRRETQNAQERDFRVDRTPTMLVSTQRLDRRGTQPATTKNFAGFNTNDELRTIALFCYGEDAACDAVLSKVTVESVGMQPLAELDANQKKLTPYRIGWIVGSVGTLIFVLVALWKRRPRAPK